MQNILDIQDSFTYRSTNEKQVLSFTISEAGVPGYEVVRRAEFTAPAGTPQYIIATLHCEASAILTSCEGKERLTNEGFL